MFLNNCVTDGANIALSATNVNALMQKKTPQNTVVFSKRFTVINAIVSLQNYYRFQVL